MSARLDELDREEWRKATRRYWPADWTDEDFDWAWMTFMAMKRRKAMH